VTGDSCHFAGIPLSMGKFDSKIMCAAGREIYFYHLKEGNAKYGSLTFDLMTFRENSTLCVEDDLGKKKERHCSERYYVPSEITWLLKTLNFKTVDIYGAKLGAFSRNDNLSTEDFEMLVIAEKI
jgi:hypothetical protein